MFLSKRLKILLLILAVMLLMLVWLVQTADAESIGECRLVTSSSAPNVGDSFTITLYINTNYNTTGFTMRQMTWDASLAELQNTEFSTVWFDSVFNDPGKLKNPGNLTYLMANKLDGVIGDNPAVIFTFKALAEGTVNFNIPQYIWSGQQGLVVDLSDTTTWSNAAVTIQSSGGGNGGNGGGDNGGGGSSPPPPPVNQNPIGIINGPFTIYVNESITLDGSNSYDEDGTIFSYHWEYGDGLADVCNCPIIEHTYTTAGNKTILLLVMDNEDATNTAMTYVNVLEHDIPDEPDQPDEPDEPIIPDQPDEPDEPEPNETNETNITEIKNKPKESFNVLYALIIIIIILIIITIFVRWARKEE